MSDLAHKKTDLKLEQMEKHLSAIYSTAQKDIQKKADEYFDKFKKDDAEKSKLVKQGKLTEEEYKTWRQGKIMYGKRFTAMKEDIAKQLLNVNQTATAYINGELPEIYTLNYNALANTVDGVGGYSFTLLDRDTVKNLAMADKSLLPFRKLDPAKDIPWNMKKINSQVLQGVIQGESIPNIAKRIGNVQEMNKDAAIRSARTIVTGAENKGRMDSYERATKDGIILKKYWISTPGKRTRDWHARAGNDYTESKAIDVEKPFIVDGEEMMFPGDASSASGHNLYNCRCSMASVVKGFKKVQVQKDMEGTQRNQPKTTTFTPAKTTEEAQQYAQQFVYRQEYESKRLGKQVYQGTVDFGKMDKNYANTFNRTMQKVFDDYDIEPLKSIEMMNFREKRWKGAETAGGAYNPSSQGSMYFNPKVFSSRSALERHLKEVQTATKKVLYMADDVLDKGTSSQSILSQVRAVKESGRLGAQQILGASKSAEATFVHEIGHMLDYKKFKTMYKEYGFDVSASMSRYGDKISGYAVSGTDEYIAESFVLHWFGHDELIDPTLKKIFEGALK